MRARTRWLFVVALTMAFMALLTVPAQAGMLKKPKHATQAQLHRYHVRSYRHAKSTLRWFRHHRATTTRSPDAHVRAIARASIRGHRWLLRTMAVKLRADRALLQPQGSSAAWAWYRRSDTQCVTNHEGGWRSVNPAGYYGRFQMDVSFQTETPFGRRAYARWGTANKWPPAVQVEHAFTIWSKYGWGRWPTYARYCA